MKGLIRLVAAGFALLATLLAVSFLAIDNLAGAGIERGASYALGVDTKVGFVRVSLVLGTLRISSLAIDNPRGFEADHLIELGSGRLEVPPETLLDPVVTIPLMELDSVKVSLEKEQGASNFGTVLANLERFESSGSRPGPVDSAEAESGKRFVVGEIVIRDVQAHVEHTEKLGKLGAVDVTIPEIRLRDVGAENAKGVAMSELTNIVVKAVFMGILKHGTSLPDFLAGDLRSSLGGLAGVPVEMVGGVTDAVADTLPGRLGNSARKLGDGVGEAGKKTLDGIGRLLGGRKDDE
jgi:hypothetical protein